MTLNELQQLYTQNNLGRFKVYTEPGEAGKYFIEIPGVGNQGTKVFMADQATIDSLDKSKIQDGGPRYWFTSGGVSQTAFNDSLTGVINNGTYSPGGFGGQTNMLDVYADSFKAQQQVSAEEQRVQQLNQAIAQGDTATVERLAPGFTMWNGAFVDKTKVPELEAQGATVQGGNVVGAPLPTLTPEQIKANTTAGVGTVPGASGGTTGEATGTTGYTRDAEGNVYNAQGTLMTLEQGKPNSLPLGTDGKPILNLETLPLRGGANPGGTTGGETGGGSTVTFDYKTAGIDDADWNAMSPAQRSVIEGAWKVGGNQYDAGLSNVSINTKLLNDAITAASKDPDIVAKYGDALKFDLNNVTNSLATANRQWAQDMGLLATAQDEERKRLAEAEASKGRAFSGFREKAKGQLLNEQTGIIESSKRGLEKTIRELGQGLESKYGTAGLSQFGNLALGYGAQPGISGFTSTYNPLGGITGTVDPAKRAEILAKGTSIFNLEKLPT